MQKGDKVIVSTGQHTDLVERQRAKFIRATPEGWIIVQIEDEQIHRVFPKHHVERP